MIKTFLFSNRNMKEVIRDPFNLLFGLGFPLVLMALLSVINNSIPQEADNNMFAIENLAPGLAMFGSAFLALFAGMLLAKDRNSSFLMRLFTSPMTSNNFILGYTLPMFAIALLQGSITFLASSLFGLEFTFNIFGAIFITTITSLLFIGLGLLFGSFLNEQGVSGICGALLINVAGWLSGLFIPLDLIGGMFQKIAHALPFYHSIEAIQATLEGNLDQAYPHLIVVMIYTIIIFIIAIFIFKNKMTSDKT